VWHLKPIWKKKIVGEIDNTYCSIFRVWNLEIWRNDFAWQLVALRQPSNDFFWFVYWKRKNMAEIF
jgi:hypothetical protein